MRLFLRMHDSKSLFLTSRMILMNDIEEGIEKD